MKLTGTITARFPHFDCSHCSCFIFDSALRHQTMALSSLAQLQSSRLLPADRALRGSAPAGRWRNRIARITFIGRQGRPEIKTQACRQCLLAIQLHVAPPTPGSREWAPAPVPIPNTAVKCPAPMVPVLRRGISVAAAVRKTQHILTSLITTYACPLELE